MANETATNGRVQRKTLASQLDRLDGILDGLSEALQGAVADAVRGAAGPLLKEAVREAVVATVQALLTNPQLQGGLAGVLTSEPVRKPEATATDGLTARAYAAAQSVARRAIRRVRTWLGKLADAAALALRLRRPLGLAIGVGVAVALACYLTGPQVAAAVSGLAGFAASLAASGLRAVRRVLPGPPATSA
jgi:hypothetical protein